MTASVYDIIRLVANRYGVSVNDLLGPRRQAHLTRPRQAAYWLAHKAGWSYANIANAIGGRDHTTVMHGCRTHERSGDDLSDLLTSLRNAHHCHACGRLVNRGNVSAEGRPWCGCPSQPTR